MLPNTADGTEVATSWPQSGELTLGYPGGPGVSTRVLKWGRVGAREMAGWKLNCCCWLWRWRRKGPGVKGIRWPLEAEKGRTDTLLVPPDRTQPSGTLISAWRGPFLLFYPTVRCLKPRSCGHLLRQQQKINPVSMLVLPKKLHNSTTILSKTP